jgi:hypothetical protein
MAAAIFPSTVDRKGLTNLGVTIYSVAPKNNARSCIYARKHNNALPLLEFCSRDSTTVRITNTRGGVCKQLIVFSAQLPCDSDESPPTKELRDINYCHNGKKQLVIGCAANAHHTLWGSSGTNPRGEGLMEFLVSSKLNILNHGNEPTFVVATGRKLLT